MLLCGRRLKRPYFSRIQSVRKCSKSLVADPVIALAYMGLLFAIAWIGDKKRIARDHRNIQAMIYSLSLAVYCTSWTFYGAVGSAATTGWGFLPIYIGPALMMLLGVDLIRRIAESSRDQRITSIADYIAYRYGRSHTIAVLVTLAAVIGSVPYIALQLKGITTGIEVIGKSTGCNGTSFWQPVTLPGPGPGPVCHAVRHPKHGCQ